MKMPAPAMIERSVCLYDRGPDGLYIHPSAFTQMGVLVAIPPFVRLVAEEKTEKVWNTVTELLQLSGRRIPHPDRWDQLDPLFHLAGCKNWRAFARSASFCTVDVVGGRYVLTPGVWDGKGYAGDQARAVELAMGESHAVCAEALLRLLASGFTKVQSQAGGDGIRRSSRK